MCDILLRSLSFDQIVTDGAHRLLQCFYEEQSRNSQVVDLVCARENASLRSATYCSCPFIVTRLWQTALRRLKRCFWRGTTWQLAWAVCGIPGSNLTDTKWMSILRFFYQLRQPFATCSAHAHTKVEDSTVFCCLENHILRLYVHEAKHIFAFLRDSEHISTVRTTIW